MAALPQHQAGALSMSEHLEQLNYFLATAPTNWQPAERIRRFLLPSGEYVSCVLWGNLFHVTGTDIIRALLFRFQAVGRPVKNTKKFEEGVFSDLRNLKPGVDASLEDNRSEFLEWLYRHNCIRTQKKQKVFFWFSVPWDQLFYDALERDLKREALGMEPTSVASAGCTLPILRPQGATSRGLSVSNSRASTPAMSPCPLRSQSLQIPTPQSIHTSHISPSSSPDLHTITLPFMASPSENLLPHAAVSAEVDVKKPSSTLNTQTDLSPFMVPSTHPTRYYSEPPFSMDAESSSNVSLLLNSFTDYVSSMTDLVKADVTPTPASGMPWDDLAVDYSSSTGKSNPTPITTAASASTDSLCNEAPVHPDQEKPALTTESEKLDDVEKTQEPQSKSEEELSATSSNATSEEVTELEKRRSLTLLKSMSRRLSLPRNVVEWWSTHGKGTEPGLNSELPLNGDAATLCKPPELPSKKALLASTATEAEPKHFFCSEHGCGRGFKRYEHLRRHMRIHSGEKPFKCPIESCGRGFSRSDNLSQHMKVHAVQSERTVLSDTDNFSRASSIDSINVFYNQSNYTQQLLQSFSSSLSPSPQPQSLLQHIPDQSGISYEYTPMTSPQQSPIDLAKLPLQPPSQYVSAIDQTGQIMPVEWQDSPQQVYHHSQVQPQTHYQQSFPSSQLLPHNLAPQSLPQYNYYPQVGANMVSTMTGPMMRQGYM